VAARSVFPWTAVVLTGLAVLAHLPFLRPGQVTEARLRTRIHVRRLAAALHGFAMKEVQKDEL